MTEQVVKTEHFLALHHGSGPLLLPNAWDRGSAALLTALGFSAVATTSSGFAATLGRLDGSVTRDEALAHAADIAASTSLPVSADLENCFADDPAGVAETIRLAARTGLAGCSLEDFTGPRTTRSTRSAKRPTGSGPPPRRRTGRARAGADRPRGELPAHPADLSDTIRRLQAYQAAGADVLYAPA